MKAYFEGDKDVLVFKPIPTSKVGRPRKNVPDTNVVKTNADHIRAMTDEELAAELSVNCRWCVYLPLRKCPKECEKGVLAWLKQPYQKEDT